MNKYKKETIRVFSVKKQNTDMDLKKAQKAQRNRVKSNCDMIKEAF